MDVRELAEKYSPLLRRYLVPLCLGFLGLIFLGYGLISFLGSKSSTQNAVSFEQSANNLETAQATESSKPTEIVVDIEGAVVKPGVYKLPQDSRIQDALTIAGGLSNTANRELVSKSLNLASKLQDGAKIYIPSKTEASGGVSVQAQDQQPLYQAVAGESSSLININSATAQQLDTLPGIGSVTSEKIINARPYGAITELVQKKVVTQKVFDKIKDKIAAY